MQKSIPIYKSKGLLPSGVDFVKRPIEFQLEQSQKLGDFFKVNFFTKKIFVTTNLEVIRHVLQANQKNYQKSPAYKNLKLALGNGLVTSEGSFWKRQRKMAQPAFYKTQLDGLFQKMTKVVEDYCEKMEQNRGGEPFDICEEMMKVTSDIVLKALFSAEQNRDKSEMAETMEFAQSHIMARTIRPFMIPIWYLNGTLKKFNENLKDFNQTIYDMIDERLTSENPPHDFLTMLVQARDGDTGEQMTNQQIRDEAMTIYAAGHETSANALNWTFYLLSKHPEVVAKIRAEVEEILGDKTPSFADLMKLQYTKQVIEEGMRLYPPAHSVGREAISEDEILGHKIPKKSILLVSIYSLHRDPKYYPNPDKFDPDRFAPEKIKERPRLAYMPFGAGPRMCIGNHFAVMEMQLLLAMLIRKFDFELVSKEPIESLALITLKPKDGIMMKIK